MMLDQKGFEWNDRTKLKGEVAAASLPHDSVIPSAACLLINYRWVLHRTSWCSSLQSTQRQPPCQHCVCNEQIGLEVGCEAVTKMATNPVTQSLNCSRCTPSDRLQGFTVRLDITLEFLFARCFHGTNGASEFGCPTIGTSMR